MNFLKMAMEKLIKILQQLQFTFDFKKLKNYHSFDFKLKITVITNVILKYKNNYSHCIVFIANSFITWVP